MKIENNKSCVCGGCIGAATIVGIIFAVLIGTLFVQGFIPLITVGIWISLGIALFALIYILAVTAFSSCTGEYCKSVRCCLRKNITCLLAGTVGTIIFALAELSIVLDLTFVAVVILVALEAFFFAFLITSLVSFVKCLIHSES